MFKSIYTTIIANIQKSLGKGLKWIIDSVIDHSISISKYNLLAGSSYIKLPTVLDYPRKKGLNPRRNTKADKDSSLYIRKCCEEKQVDLLLIGKGEKKHCVLVKILICSCMIILYIVEKHIFTVNVSQLLVQKKYKKSLLNTVL